MKRRREIATAPKRSASQSVDTIGDLVRDTLATSANIELEDVEAALGAAHSALLGLVAGGHLDRNPLVLVAASLHLSVTTVSGDGALTVDENLAAVPGAATATTWTLYLPTPDPLGDIVATAAKGHERLSIEVAPTEASTAVERATIIDLGAFARREG